MPWRRPHLHGFPFLIGKGLRKPDREKKRDGSKTCSASRRTYCRHFRTATALVNGGLVLARIPPRDHYERSDRNQQAVS
jgi:uncharacterized membrane protein YidH (DUF202 family)